MKLKWKVDRLICLFSVFILLNNVKNLSLKETNMELNSASHLAEVTNESGSELNTQTFSKLRMTDEQKKVFDSIKKPDAPNEIPEEVKFMQSELDKGYGAAKAKAMPRFVETNSKSEEKLASLFPEDKRHIHVPIFRHGYHDETTIPINNAWSNSIYSYRFLWWWSSYPASNAIYGHSYWCSSGNHGQNDIVIWEAQFNDLIRIHGMNMIWAYAPKRYAIEYSNDGHNYKTLIDWRDSITGGTKTWWATLIPALKMANRSFPDRLTFDNPVFVRKIRILMKGPVNFYFGLYKVDIFVKNWTMVIKNSSEGQCREDCWVVNTVHAGMNTPVKFADCVGTIGYSENRELFTLLYDSRLVHYNSGLCVVSGYSKQVLLEDCNHAKESHDGREKFNFYPDGRITPFYMNDECIYKPTDEHSTDISESAIVEASSEIPDDGHRPFRVNDGNDGSYWASNPGENIVTLTLYFKKWESMQEMSIRWKYKAENFDIYAYTLENGWKLVLRITGNTISTNMLKLNRINARAVQIKMNTTKQKYLGKPIYGISSVSITDGAKPLKRKKCNELRESLKKWLLDDQWYYYVGNKAPYVKAYNSLSITYLKLRSLNRRINIEWVHAIKAKTKAVEISKLLEKTNISLGNLSASLKVYKTEKFNNADKAFGAVFGKHKLNYFFPYFPASKKPEEKSGPIGSVFNSPGKDCWQIKQLLPFKKSGYYWIQPECAKKPIRVFCDFSVDGMGTSIYIWRSSHTTLNTPIIDKTIKSVKDVQRHCAGIGLEPIKLNNDSVVYRITQFLRAQGYNLAKPAVIPLGFDWGCEQGHCSLSYKSFNSRNSKFVLSFFPTPDKKVWIYNKVVKYNSVGLGYNRFAKPIFFNLENAKVAALVCSTNEHAPPLSDPTEAILQCSDILSGNPKIDGSVGSILKIHCPAFCSEKSEHKVYGKAHYSDNSSVCRAAIHAGIIKNEQGGTFFLKIGPPYKHYGYGTKNGVKSLEWKVSTQKSFSLQTYRKKCPIEYFKSTRSVKEKLKREAEGSSPVGEGGDSSGGSSGSKGGSSVKGVQGKDGKTLISDATPAMIQKKSPHKFNGANGKVFHYENPKPKVTPTVSKSNNGVDLNFFKGHNGLSNFGKKSRFEELDSLVEDYSLGPNKKPEDIMQKATGANPKSESGKGKSDSSGKGSKTTKKGNKLPGVGSIANKKRGPTNLKDLAYNAGVALNNRGEAMRKKLNQMKMASNPKDNPTKINSDKKQVTQKEPCVLNTDTFIREITDFRHLDYPILKHYKVFGTQMKALIQQFRAEFSFSVYPSTLSNEHFELTFSKLTKLSTYLQGYFAKIREKGEGRIKNTFTVVKALGKKLAWYSQTHPMVLDYEKQVEKTMDIFSYRQVLHYPGKWRYVNSNLQGRSGAIQQYSRIYGKQSLGTIITPKNKNYFDFILNADIMTRSRGSCGVVFRMEDPFNFYALEFNIDGGYKRLIRNKFGSFKVIKTIHDGGISQNNWFKIYIHATEQSFVIKFGDAKKYDSYQNMPTLFEFKEHSFVSGKIGFFTNGNDDFYFDELKIQPLVCRSRWQANSDLKIFIDSANLFHEDFLQSFKSKYETYTPPNAEGAPAKWGFFKHAFGKEHVLVQNSFVKDIGLNQELAITALKDVYIRGKGLYEFHFRAMNSGVVGAVTKFLNPNTYMIFEIGGGDNMNDRFFQCRKKVNGQFSLIYRISTSDELKNVPFFGYERNTWYALSIEIDHNETRIFMALLGTTDKHLIMKYKDDQIPMGRVGMGSLATRVAYAHISVSPLPIPYSEREIPASISQVTAEEDILLSKFFKNPGGFNRLMRKTGSKALKEAQGLFKFNFKKNLLKSSYVPTGSFQYENSNSKPWEKCYETRTPEERSRFCSASFRVSKSAVEKCRNNFCFTCCTKLVPEGHNIIFHNCKKQCHRETVKSSPKESSPLWKTECINPSNSDKNVYTYCDSHFSNDLHLNHNCKLDSCRLCCATHDRAFKNTSASLTATDDCFKSCAIKFPSHSLKK